MKIRGRDASPLLFMYKFVKRTKRRHRARLESPVNGDSFGMVVAECQKAPRTGSCRREATEGLRANSKAAVQPLRLIALLASTSPFQGRLNVRVCKAYQKAPSLRELEIRRKRIF